MFSIVRNWIAKRSIEGIVKSQYGLYDAITAKNLNMNESEICEELFLGRFNRLFKCTKKEKAKINKLLEEEGYPTDLFELCLSIATVEFNPEGLDQYFYIHDIILEKLNSMGYEVKIKE
ncbi:MAG: hypothetical protein K9M75_00305 [Phycisphaerae bacterium]|nr:hypothetical protein [Phycisphaerae bacterium]